MTEESRHELEKSEVGGIQPVCIQQVLPRDSYGEFSPTVAAVSTTKHNLMGASRLRISMSVSGGAYAGGDTLTVTLYRLMRKIDETTGRDIETAVPFNTTLSVTLGAIVSGKSVITDVPDASSLVAQATHYSLSGNITIAASRTAIMEVEKVISAGDMDAVVDQLVIANGLLGTIDADTGAIKTATEAINTKTPALGQALAAASTPVVLPAAQASDLKAVTEASAADIKTAAQAIAALIRAASDSELPASNVLPVKIVDMQGLVMPAGARTVTGTITVTATVGVSGQIDLSALGIDVRKFNTIQVRVCPVANTAIEYNAGDDTTIGLFAKGVEIAGDANGNCIKRKMSSAVKDFGFVANRNYQAGSTAAGVIDISTVNSKSYGNIFAYADALFDYKFINSGGTPYDVVYSITFMY